MNIHEHQAKDILKEFKAPVSKGIVIYSTKEIKEKNFKSKLQKVRIESSNSRRWKRKSWRSKIN